MEAPFVSVLMTVYNREKYIAEAIESVLSSSYTNFELIIVDDCSSDNSVEIARTYEKKDERIRVYVNEKNIEQFPNRNRAASYAKGKYIKYLDSDDLIYPHALQLMVDAMEKYPEAALGVASDKPGEFLPFPFVSDSQTIYFEHFLRRGFFSCGPSAAIIRRDIFERNNFFGNSFFVGSDTETWLRLAAKYSVVKFQPALIWWRRHEEQEFNIGQKTGEYAKKNFFMMKEILESSHCPLRQEEIKEALRLLKKREIVNIIKLFFSFNFALAFKMFFYFNLSLKDIFLSVSKNKYSQ